MSFGLDLQQVRIEQCTWLLCLVPLKHMLQSLLILMHSFLQMMIH